MREHCITRHGGVGRLWALLLAKTNTSDERNKIMYYCVWRKYSENLACKRRFHGDILTTKVHTHTKRGTKQDKLRTSPRRLPFPPTLSSSIILLSLLFELYTIYPFNSPLYLLLVPSSVYLIFGVIVLQRCCSYFFLSSLSFL